MSSAGRIEMKVMDTPASVPSRAARGVTWRMNGAMKPPIIRMKLWKNTQTSPACQPLTGSPVLSAIGSMITKVTMNMWGTLIPEGSAQTSSRPVDLGETIGEPGVVHRAQEQHQPDRGQDASEHQRVGHLEHEAQQRRQREHVDEDVGAEAEEGVPVAGRPYLRAKSRIRHCVLLTFDCERADADGFGKRESHRRFCAGRLGRESRPLCAVTAEPSGGRSSRHGSPVRPAPATPHRQGAIDFLRSIPGPSKDRATRSGSQARKEHATLGSRLRAIAGRRIS